MSEAYFILWEVQGGNVFKTCLMETLKIAKAFREELQKNPKTVSSYIFKYEGKGIYMPIRV